MVTTYRQANLPVHFEAAAGREEAERGRFERVRGREHDAAVVEASLEGGRRGWAADCEVPFEEVCFERRGVVVGGGRGGELGCFAEDAFDCGVFGGELAGCGHSGGGLVGGLYGLRWL